VAASLGARVDALRVTLTPQDIERAYSIANGSEAVRARFHEPYILPVSDDTVERLEIVTEYRRFVLAAEEQLRLGNWSVARGSRSLGGRGIADDLQPWQGEVSLIAKLRFNPLNTYESVPEYEIRLGDAVPIKLTRTPTLALSSAPGRRGTGLQSHQAILGATLEAVFEAAAIGQRSQAIRLTLQGEMVKEVTADFARLE